MKTFFINMLLIFTATLSFAQVPNYVPTNGLVGWWPFNGNANDESGNGNNGTVNGATLTTDRNGQANKAYSFNNSSILVPNSNSLQINNQFTLSFWMYANSFPSPVSTIFSKGSDLTAFTWIFYINTNGFGGLSVEDNTVGNDCGSGNNIAYTTNNWINVVSVIDGTSSKIYVNGNLVNSNTCISSIFQNSYNLYFGKMNHPTIHYYWNGKIDDIGIWNRALNQCEIADLYNAQVGSSATTNTITQSSCNGYTLNNQTYTQSGTYSQNLINAAGCDSIITLNLTINQPTTNTLTQSSCNSFTLNNQTYTQSGTYTQNLTNAAGCDSIITLNLTINNSPTASGSSTGATFHGATDGTVNLTVNGGAAPYSFNWSNGANSEDLNAVAAGTYDVTITDANNCSTTTSVTVNQPPLALVKSPESLISSALYPNPATAQTRLDLQLNQAQDFEIAVYNNLGQRIFNKNFSNTKELSENIDMRSWPAGQYFVEIKLPNGKETKKLIKE